MKIKCPHCHREIETAVVIKLGQQIICPSCQKRFVYGKRFVAPKRLHLSQQTGEESTEDGLSPLMSWWIGFCETVGTVCKVVGYLLAFSIGIWYLKCCGIPYNISCKAPSCVLSVASFLGLNRSDVGIDRDGDGNVLGAFGHRFGEIFENQRDLENLKRRYDGNALEVGDDFGMKSGLFKKVIYKFSNSHRLYGMSFIKGIETGDYVQAVLRLRNTLAKKECIIFSEEPIKRDGSGSWSGEFIHDDSCYCYFESFIYPEGGTCIVHFQILKHPN